jgi:hypothetical protein
MTTANYDAMSLDELRQYVLIHREELEAFHVYIDRSKSSGRMITINLDDPSWEENLDRRIQQSAGEAEAS